MNTSHVYNGTVPAVKSPRRQPVQARSQARVERILAAATALVEEDGVDAATTRAIAAAAGVPVATLYQFFADRDAVLDAVLERELEALDRHVAAESRAATATAGSPTATIEGFVDFAVEVHRAYYRSRPAFARLWFGGRRTPPVEAAVRARGRRLAHQWHAVMVATGLIGPATDPIVAEMAVELGDRVFECAYRRGPEAEEAIFAEGKRAVAAYLQQHAP